MPTYRESVAEKQTSLVRPEERQGEKGHFTSGVDIFHYGNGSLACEAICVHCVWAAKLNQEALTCPRLAQSLSIFLLIVCPAILKANGSLEGEQQPLLHSLKAIQVHCSTCRFRMICSVELRRGAITKNYRVCHCNTKTIAILADCSTYHARCLLCLKLGCIEPNDVLYALLL